MAGRRHRGNEKRGWGQKTPRTVYFGEENWEGCGPPYKPIYITRFGSRPVDRSYRASKQVVCIFPEHVRVNANLCLK
jgi:hypothetical protein